MDSLLLIIAVTITVVLLLIFVYFVINEIAVHNKWSDRTPLHQSRQCTESGVEDRLSEDVATASQYRDVDCRSCRDNPTITRTVTKFQGTESVADVHCHFIEKLQEPSLQNDNHGPSFYEAPHTNYKFSSLKVTHSPDKVIQNESSLAYIIKQKDLEVPHDLKQVHRKLEMQNTSNEHLRQIVRNEPVKPLQEKLSSTLLVPRLFTGYNKPTYAANTYSSLPHSNKFLVKEKHRESSGITRVKLILKSAENESPKCFPDENVEKDGANIYDEKADCRENIKCTSHVIFTSDRRFRGDKKYPLPSIKATDLRIGNSGNGFMFTIYCERKQYTVKKIVYRPNEINVHSALKHENNILPLVAVLMGEKHNHYSGRFYHFHFTLKMNYDLRKILLTKEVGFLKHLYNHCSTHVELEKLDTAYRNTKFLLSEILKALAYLYNNGYVQRDVKASNIMVKMRYQCKLLSCICKTEPQIKLGASDSAGTVSGLGITEPTDQIIKFASILPLGTPGYRAPEVSMHITLSGPYEALYTTAIDMWSFGCLCLNIWIGKTAALKQREEASLLLPLTRHTCSQESWEKTTKQHLLEEVYTVPIVMPSQDTNGHTVSDDSSHQTLYNDNGGQILITLPSQLEMKREYILRFYSEFPTDLYWQQSSPPEGPLHPPTPFLGPVVDPVQESCHGQSQVTELSSTYTMLPQLPVLSSHLVRKELSAVKLYTKLVEDRKPVQD